MWFFVILSWFGLIVQLFFVILSVAAGLYYLAELVEEYSVVSAKVIKYMILTILLIYLCLFLFEDLPSSLIFCGIFSNFMHLLILRTFPYFEFTSIPFITSIILLIANHYFAFSYFGSVYYPFTQVLSFFTLCLWLIPFAFFISLSANENVLPTTMTETKPILSDESDVVSHYFSRRGKRYEDSVSKKDVSTNRKLNVKVIVNDSIKEIDVKSEDKNLNRIKEYNELTKIKPKTTQLNSDSDDEDFIEVSPQTYNSSDKEFSDNELQNQDLNESEIQTIDSNEDSINLDEFYDIQDSKPIKEGSTPLKECISEEPEPSTSKPIEYKAISRKEMLETCREANKQNRFANHTTDQMMTDCQELLTLFGIPFVLSPMEAEAKTRSKPGLNVLSQKVKNQRKRRQIKTSKTQAIKNPSKRRQTSSKARPQGINLSESSESE